MPVRYPGFDTLALHAGQTPDPATGSRAVPIHETASFVFEDSDHAAALFNMERSGHVYSRISNPTVAMFEERMAALETGVGAIATASGQAALDLAIVTLMGAGGHVVASRSLYGGPHNLLGYTLARFGIDTTFVDPRNLGAWEQALRSNTPGCGKSVNLNVRTDPSIVDGVIVKLGSRMVDASVRTKLNAIRTRMKEVG